MRPSCPPTILLPFLVLAAAPTDRGTSAQVRLQLHSGAHLPTTALGIPLEVNDIRSADMDGDGNVDIVLALNTGGFRVCFGGGDGTFRRFGGYGVAASRNLAIGDVDGDGDGDVLCGGGRTAYGGPAAIELWLNDGAGTFSASLTVPAINAITVAIELVDLDGDLDPDALVFDSFRATDAIRLWRNDGSGNFTDATSSALPPQSGRPSYGAAADLDGDGLPDIAYQVSTGTEWWRNDGTGSFVPVTSFLGSMNLLTDLDGDGDVDVLSGNGVRLNDGTGRFSGLVGSLPWIPVGKVVAADFDGDGRVDLAGTTTGALPFLWRDTGGHVFQDVTATWFEPHVLRDRTVDYHYGTCGTLDCDGDGDPDLVTGGAEGRNNASTTIGIPPRLLLNSSARFVDAARPAVPLIQEVAHDVETGDVDGDGDLDLLLNGGTLLRQGEDGVFTDSGIVPNFGRARLGDVDGDQDLDLMTVGFLFSQAGPGLWLNDGGGQFTDVTATNTPVLGGITASLALGDVDGDGDVDAVIGSLSPSFTGVPLTLWLNDGIGVFQDASTRLPTVMVDAFELRLADFDGDGDLDLLAGLGAFGTQAHLLLENDGGGNFADVTATNLPATTGVGMDVRDLDGDGDLDVGLQGSTLLNDGSAVFTSVPAATGRVLVQVQGEDPDEDGQPEDVVQGTHGITVAGQAFPWGFDATRHVVWSADVDADGDRDLVVGCELQYAFNRFYRGHVGVLYNLRRDLVFSSLPRLGQECRVEARACGNGNAGTLVFVAVATARLASPLDLQGLGKLWLDPSRAATLGLATIPDADTSVEMGLTIPALTALVGVPLSSQALFVPVGNERLSRLSAAITHELLP